MALYIIRSKTRTSYKGRRCIRTLGQHKLCCFRQGSIKFLNDAIESVNSDLILHCRSQTGTLTEGKPAVSKVAAFDYEESEILKIAAAVEKTVTHPIAKAIINKAEALNLEIPVTRGQLVEPGFGTLAEVDGRLVAVGTSEWVNERFQKRTHFSTLMKLEHAIGNQSSNGASPSNYSNTVVYVGREGEGIIGAIAISDSLRHDAESTVSR